MVTTNLLCSEFSQAFANAWLCNAFLDRLTSRQVVASGMETMCCFRTPRLRLMGFFSSYTLCQRFHGVNCNRGSVAGGLPANRK